MNIFKNLLFFNDGLLSDIILGYLEFYKELFCFGESLVFVLISFLLIYQLEADKGRKVKKIINEICAILGFSS